MNGGGIPELLTEQAETAADMWRLFLVLALAVLALVLVLVLYVVIRFRRRDDSLPPQTHYRIPLEITYTVLPLLLIVGLFVVTVRSIDDIDEAISSPDLQVDVVGSQWQWQFTYPDSGVIVGGDDTERPEMWLPAGSSVRFNLETVDVIHSFWVPGFLFKRDLIPGSPSSFDVDVKQTTGRWTSGVCAEFCGLYHDRMDFAVRVVSPDDFQKWLDGQEGTS